MKAIIYEICNIAATAAAIMFILTICAVLGG
jgi:hypothetical protein